MDLICLEPPADYTDYADHADWEMGERATRTTRTTQKPRIRDLWFGMLVKKYFGSFEIIFGEWIRNNLKIYLAKDESENGFVRVVRGFRVVRVAPSMIPGWDYSKQ